MKKFFTVIIALVMTAGAASAGNNNLPFLKFGAKLGMDVQKQNVSLSETLNNLENILNDPSTGYFAGITARVKIPVIPIFVQGELLYNWNNIKVNGVITSKKITISNFNAPVMVGAGIGVGDMLRIRINAGPVFNFSTKVKAGDTEVDFIEPLLEKPAVTWTAGVGLDLFGLTIDGRYNGQFKENKVAVGSVAKPSSWSLSVGFLF